MQLTYVFDLFLDIKTHEQLEKEYHYLTTRLTKMKQLMRDHDIYIREGRGEEE